jgi:hypothetical protein
MILHGYFILGNIGESVEEMNQIVSFAHGLGVDTLNLTLLRNSPHSGLDELVAQNPEYHISPSGKVYSNHCTLNELKSLRHKMYQKFYTKRQMLRVLNKGYRSGLGSLFSKFILNTPNIAFALGARSVKSKVI